MIIVRKGVFVLLFLLLITSCTNNHDDVQPVADSLDVTNAKIIRSFYPSPQKDEFEARCITCHSLRYIEMQPAFPRKTWEKIVDKMVKNFGAPIPDSSAKKIVDYLMEIKGK